MQKLFMLVAVVSTLSSAGLSAQDSAPEAPKFRFLNYVSLSPDGKLLATYQRAHALRSEHHWEVQHILMDRIRIWNTATGKLVRQIPGPDKESIDPHLGNVDSAVFSGDGKCLICCFRDGFVEYWDTATWQAVRRFSVTPRPGKGAKEYDPFWNMAVSVDAQWLAVSNDSQVWYWDARSEKCVFTAEVAKDCALALSRDGNVLAAGDDVWDLTRLKELYQIGVVRGIWNDTWTLTAQGQECSPPFLNTRVIGTALNGDGKRLVALETYRWGGAWTGYWAYSLKSFDTVTRKELGSFEGDRTELRSFKCLALTNNDKWLIGAGEKVLQVWDVATGKKVRTFQGVAEEIVSLSISADDKRLTTGSTNGTARLWDIDTGKELRVFNVFQK